MNMGILVLIIHAVVLMISSHIDVVIHTRPYIHSGAGLRRSTLPPVVCDDMQ
jgi:hypothetical protein